MNSLAVAARNNSWRRGLWPSPHQVEGEPVHEERLRRRHGHCQVHAQLVPCPSHWDSLSRRLRQDL